MHCGSSSAAAGSSTVHRCGLVCVSLVKQFDKHALCVQRRGIMVIEVRLAVVQPHRTIVDVLSG